jgi:hypothetical protein
MVGAEVVSDADKVFIFVVFFDVIVSGIIVSIITVVFFNVVAIVDDNVVALVDGNVEAIVAVELQDGFF